MAKFEPPRGQQVTMADVERQFDRMAKSTPFWREAPPASIDPSSINSRPLLVRHEPSALSNYTVTNTAASPLASTSGYFDVTGQRDVEVRITASVQAPASQYVVVSAIIDGEAHRVSQTNATGEITLTGHYTTPAGNIPPGRRLFSVGAHVTSGTATVFAGPAGANYIEMLVKEVL